jgi:CRISPR-associated protein Cas2
MPRRHFLISYDVANDKRRTRIFETLRDYGDHTQFSVFLCELDEADLAALRGLLEPLVHRDQDQVLLVDLGPAEHERQTAIDAIGKPFDPRPNAFIV